jgi:phosphoribosylanthranilate isomerase
MPVLVKICGLKTPDALDAALESGADLVGFVFFPPSPRKRSLCRWTPPTPSWSA